jgi:hypothetical protein
LFSVDTVVAFLLQETCREKGRELNEGRNRKRERERGGRENREK